ncbi:hypothetical protein L1887_14252 [Cichorium endivia]|nr:hypothetical protein L1887_14248 [Cichorium endivia]KAI3515369.1 hypothetical protein L1887_14252 [Cichorium endivia]
MFLQSQKIRSLRHSIEHLDSGRNNRFIENSVASSQEREVGSNVRMILSPWSSHKGGRGGDDNQKGEEDRILALCTRCRRLLEKMDA